LASTMIPKSKAAHPEAKISLHIWRGSKDMILHATSDKQLLHSIFALSWFLLVGSVYMSQFPNYAQAVLKANNEVYILFLTTFSIGIAAGALLCDSALGGKISGKLTPIAALGVSIFTYGMVFATPMPTHEALVNAKEFISIKSHWPMIACTGMVALCGGMYMVPLYAILQSRTKPAYRSRVLSASNFSDSIFMTLAAVISAMLLYWGLGIKDLFLVLATLNLYVAWYARKIA
jgi:acyl-[acyl-carrier-protein]-phospholipid O-acyltransferase / long-chain-fatty-acid--[acyl-carrier-protein] ligase